MLLVGNVRELVVPSSIQSFVSALSLEMTEYYRLIAVLQAQVGVALMVKWAWLADLQCIVVEWDNISIHLL